MPSRVVKVCVKPDQKVKEGELLLVLESMKMEMSLKSRREGVVGKIRCKPNLVVKQGECLLSVHPPSSPKSNL